MGGIIHEEFEWVLKSSDEAQKWFRGILDMIETLIKMTVGAIDSEEYCMMLLPEEY